MNRDEFINNIQIRPSYAHKPKAVENLMRALPSLLELQTADESGTLKWKLDKGGDTIHRYVSFVNEDEIPTVLKRISAASRDLKHDPHTFIDGTGMTISCTTHVPPGLSMKDVKLAREIDEILREVGSAKDDASQVEGVVSAEQRQRGEEQNMDAIRKAKEDCNCG